VVVPGVTVSEFRVARPEEEIVVTDVLAPVTLSPRLADTKPEAVIVVAVSPASVVAPVTPSVPPTVALPAKNKFLGRVAPEAPMS
jgi:hypothetical protein